ncbi:MULTISPECIES: SMP-30/gluconolactonase/LRE family protein [Arenibacter]|uniref:SMP-30/gluconolactonase/LRE family protein n=1 Tax=Arenibacter TaxID=178469 RepID=UPI000857871C|nr:MULTISPECIES: SMP-30/gluconolactonase/LRE family protein [Arenibacter]GBF17855.1 gluconolactonase precursor [Arenibacter sp. NBRC 103722]
MKYQLSPFIKFNLSVICLLLMVTGCKDKQPKDTPMIPGEIVQEANSSLYHSSQFTKPSGFPSGIEGPAVDANGILYAVNFEIPGTIGQVVPQGMASLFVNLPEGSIGNGIRFNSKGEMFIADYTKHNILKVDMDTKEISVFAHNGDMNQPNDIAIMDNDILFASDPDWKNSKGQIWRIDTEGKITLLEGDMGTTNGIEVSPDNRTLYVNESVQRNVWAYDLSPTGYISNKRLLIKFEDFGMDGMRTDVKGNLYITRHGKGTVVKVSPEGKILQEVQLKGKTPSNIAFGGKDGTMAFVTLQDNGNFEAFETEHPGREFIMMDKSK